MFGLDNITIEQLLENLKYYGELIIKIILLYIIIRISSALVVWFWRTLVVPFFKKRAYFHFYQNDGFYSEERPLGLFRRIRNVRWTIKDKMVGYVERNRGDIDKAFDHVIYLKSHGRNPVGGAIYDKGVCKIYLNYHDKEGGISPLTHKPVGYIDNGKVYKYYEDREHWLRDEPLEVPEFIGDCECPGHDWFGRKKWETEGEKPDEDVLPYIEEERVDASDRDGFTDSWPYFRKNMYRRKKVRTKQMSGGISVQDGKTFYAMLSSRLWRFLHVYPTGWDNKAMAWGYGYCTEDWRNPFRNHDDDGTPMICRAAAALLLARYEGFVLAPSEIPQEEKRGPVPTVLLSFCLYLLLFPFFERIAKYLVFPFLGTMLNEAVVLVALFFVLWLFIVHPIRCLLMNRTDALEAFLAKLNTNVGVTGWMVLLVTVSCLGILASIFWIDYRFFPVYVCALITCVLIWSVYNARRWPIESYVGSTRTLGDDDGPHEEETEGRRKKKDRRHSKDNKGLTGLGKDEDQENGVEKPQDAYLITPTRHLHFNESLFFNENKLLELRKRNPFRASWAAGGKSYQAIAAGMVEQELKSKESEDGIYTKINRMAALVDAFSVKHRLSSIEKIQLIMALCQPTNIDYQYDELCDELLIEEDRLINFAEYCRFPTETLHDKKGDCDCHAALAGALFAACGYPCCYLIGKALDCSHAALGLEITDDLKALRQYKDAVFSKGNKDYLYIETAGKCSIGQVPPGFEEMLQGDLCPIEPNKKN